MKKFLAVTIVAIMILSIASIPVLAVSTDDAVVNIDFANGIPAGMDVVGAELVNDADKGQVLSFAGGDTGTSKASLPMDSLATTDFSAGMSWTVWAKAEPGIHGAAPIFTVDFTQQGYLSLLADHVLTANTDGNQPEWGIERVWSDPPQPVNEEESVMKNEWTHYAIVIDDTASYLYVNGKVYEKNPFSDGNLGNMTTVLLEEMAYATGIQLGSYNCDWWKFGDYAGLMSSAALYNKALTADEIKELYVASGGVVAEEVTTEAPAPVETDTTAAIEETTTAEATVDNETTTSAANNDEESSNTMMIILIIAGVVVVVVVIVVVAVNSGKKGKK